MAKRDFLEDFQGKENKATYQAKWEKYLKRTVNNGITMWDAGYRIKIEYKNYSKYWVFLVYPRS